MKKVYYILTILLSVLATLLFIILAVASRDEVSTAVASVLLAVIAAGCLTVSILGLKNNNVISGTVLEKIGIILMGFGALALVAGLFSIEKILEALLLSVPACGAGACCFKKGIDVIEKKNGKAGYLIKNKAWLTYVEMLCKEMPSLRETLRNGASMREVKEAETEMGVVFPKELKGLYYANDGDSGEAICGMMLGFHFLSIETLRLEWRRSYADKKWIPICSDGGGNFIGVDLDAGDDGPVGRVISFGRDEQGKTVLAENLNAFFDRFTRIVSSDDFHVGIYDGEKVILVGTEDAEEGFYLTDYLKSAESVK